MCVYIYGDRKQCGVLIIKIDKLSDAFVSFTRYLTMFGEFTMSKNNLNPNRSGEIYHLNDFTYLAQHLSKQSTN